MFNLDASGSSLAVGTVTTVLDILKRLTAALHLLRMAEEIIPALVNKGSTTGEGSGTSSTRARVRMPDVTST